MSGAQTRISANFSYNNSRSGIIGNGRYGIVFHGTFFDQNVAVKRIQLIEVNPREEVNLRVLNHDNVVKLKCLEENENFRFLVFELCATDLDNYLNGKYKGQPIKLPSDVQVLLQLSRGLDYIHTKNMIHRDIKPGNILISKTDPVRMIWADFGYSKLTNNRGSTSQSGFRGTHCWVAPEILRLRSNSTNARSSKQSDVFSTGCVFFYFLKRRLHPFGEDDSVEGNIARGKIINADLVANDPVIQVVVIPMIAHKSEDRISLTKVIEFLEDPEGIPAAFETLKTKLLESKLIKINENLISISTLLQQEKKTGWTIQAQVIQKSQLLLMESIKPGVPPTKYFFVELADGSGTIRARAWTAKNCDKFYPLLKKGKKYFIQNSTLTALGEERILSLRAETEIIPIRHCFWIIRENQIYDLSNFIVKNG